ncbi:MAG: hypothetical protein ACYSYM_03230 [Planctomycetota bacterium]|jgi:hypothetical protein
MNRRRTAALAAVAFVCAAISFFNARLTALSNQDAGQGPSRRWLSEASGAVVALEDRFAEELDGLITNLTSEQKSLALALEDPCTPNEVVLEHTENVISAHEHLIGRIGEHVVELRGQLPASDQDYLMGLCAETVRGPISRLGGRIGGGGGHGPGGRGPGYGRGGAGRRGGGGYGMRMNARSRLAHRLRLDEEQLRVLQEKDSGFEADSERLRDVLLTERAKLLAVFEDRQSTGEELLRQIDRLISAHSQIERRIAKHVLVLRPYLTIEQQKWLIGLCRRSQSGS